MGDTTETKERGAAITEQQVFATCDSYFEEHNKAPSQQYIRDLIGGSASTIGRFLRQWKENKPNEAQVTLSMPDHIRDSGLTFIANLWQSIQPTINGMISTAQELADQKVSAAEQEVNDAIANQVWLEQENERLVTDAETTKHDHQKKIKNLQVQLNQSQLERTQANQQAHTEREIMIAKLARITGERDALKLQISQHNTAINNVQESCKKQLEQAGKEETRLSSELSKLKDSNSDLAKDNKIIVNKLSDLKSATAKIEGELSSTQQHLKMLNTDIKAERIEFKNELALAQKDKTKAEEKLKAQIELWQLTASSTVTEKSGGE
tara:strand:+ start:4755 stop:5723 length:969 start_codon:yes stop_codon:yes gene_type:complete